MLPVWLGFERQYALMGLPADSGVLAEARDLTVICLTFELRLDSTATLSDADGVGYESTVHSALTLRFNPDDFTISGAAALVNTAFEFRMAGCTVSSVRGGSAIEVFKLIPLDEPDQGLGYVRDFLLSYMPDITTESYTAVCPNMGPLSVPAFAAWYMAFAVNHGPEIGDSSDELYGTTPGAGYTSFNWEIVGGELVACKEWTGESEGLVETGTFELYHRPGQ